MGANEATMEGAHHERSATWKKSVVSGGSNCWRKACKGRSTHQASKTASSCHGARMTHYRSPSSIGDGQMRGVASPFEFEHHNPDSFVADILTEATEPWHMDELCE